MKKYLQITVVLAIFGLLVFLRQVWGKEDMLIVGNKTQQDLTANNPFQTSQPQVQTPTPLPSSASKTQATAQPTVQPTIVPTVQPTAVQNTGAYKNGTYTGNVVDAFYGNIQVQAIIANGKITDVIFLQHPGDNNTSQNINDQAMPFLKQEAIMAQSAQVDIVSGASASSQAFQQSLASALAQAK